MEAWKMIIIYDKKTMHSKVYHQRWHMIAITYFEIWERMYGLVNIWIYIVPVSKRPSLL
jgi:hypothetical protein